MAINKMAHLSVHKEFVNANSGVYWNLRTHSLWLLLGALWQGVTSSCLQAGICCPHLVSYGENQCSPTLAEEILVWRTAQEGGYLFSLQWFLDSFPQANNQKIFPLLFTTRAVPRSLLSSLQKYHCWVSGHFSSVMISFYYRWLPNSSHVKQTGKSISVCCLCFVLIPSKGNKGGFLHPSEVSLNIIILAHWQRGNALSFFFTKKRTTPGAEWCQHKPSC